MWWVVALILAGVAWWWFRRWQAKPKLTILRSDGGEPTQDIARVRSARAVLRESASTPEADTSSYPWPFDIKVEVSTGPARPIKDYAVPQFRISYADVEGAVTDRDIFVSGSSGSGQSTIFHCWCFLRNEERSFRNDRILAVTNLKTGRPIKNLAKYMADYRSLNIR